MFNIGDLVVLERGRLTLSEWKTDEEPYIAAMVISKEESGCAIGKIYEKANYYNLLSSDGRTFINMREDRLKLLAKCQ